MSATAPAPPAPRDSREQPFTPPPDQQLRRSRRHHIRTVLWRASSLRRVAFCGRFLTGSHVGLRLTAGAAGYAGLQLCASVWACPICSSKILARRSLEIGSALAMAQARGWTLAFATFTMRHSIGEPLPSLWKSGQAGWQRAISGNAWNRAQRRCGVIGWIRVWEVTHGANGWHVHVHVALVLDAGADASTLDDVCSGMFERWSKGLTASGRRAPLRKGQEWHIVQGEDAGAEIADYLAKLNRSTPAPGEALGLELTHVRPGRSRKALATQPVWSLLEAVVDDGDAEALDLWHQWEKGSKGKRQVGWSKGLRDLLAVPDEKTDDELNAEELGDQADELVAITAGGWASMVRQPARIPQLLDVAERSGLAGVRAQLNEWGDVPYLLGLGGLAS